MNEMHTPCKQCLFARFNGSTQTGCELGRTEKFRAQKCLLEVRDEHSEFFVVDGRLCNAYRSKDSDWARKNPSDRASKVRAEAAVRMGFVVFAGFGASVEDVERTVRSLASQTLPAAFVCYVHNRDENAAALHAVLWSALGNRVSWRLTAMTQEDVAWWQAIHAGVSSLAGCNWYAVVPAGWSAPERFIEEIDVALNDEMERFVLLEGPGGVLVVQKGFHDFAGGHEPCWAGEPEQFLADLPAKARFHAGENQTLVRRTSAVVPCLVGEE